MTDEQREQVEMKQDLTWIKDAVKTLTGKVDGIADKIKENSYSNEALRNDINTHSTMIMEDRNKIEKNTKFRETFNNYWKAIVFLLGSNVLAIVYVFLQILKSAKVF